MIRRPPRSTQSRSSAASDVYKRQGPGTLGYSADGFLARLSLLMPAFSLVWRPRLDHSAASLATRRSPTHQHAWTTHKCMAGQSVNATASVVCLSPATLSARNHLTSELLRTL